MSRVTPKERTLVRRSQRVKTGIEGHDLPQMPNRKEVRRRRSTKGIESFSAHGLKMSSATHAQKEDSTGTTRASMRMRTRKRTSCPEVKLPLFHLRTPPLAERQPRVAPFQTPNVCQCLPMTARDFMPITD